MKLTMTDTPTTEDVAEVRGITGYTLGNYLSIELLWVSATLCHTGAGSQLMQSVEQEALQRGCKFAQVDTFSFQARPFYEKHGYQLKMALENVVDEYHRYYLTKNLIG